MTLKKTVISTILLIAFVAVSPPNVHAQAQLTLRNNQWVYVNNNVVQTSFTGLVQHQTNKRWFYVKNGQIDWKFTGLVQHQTNKGWFYVKNGQIDWKFTGLVQHQTNKSWFYVKKGKIDWKFTGLVQHTDNKHYYVKNGKIDWSFSGMFNGSTFSSYILKGIAQTTPSQSNQPRIYSHPEYGRYVSVTEFGADKTGKVSSSDAIHRALQFAHTNKTAIFFGEGEFYITESILLNYRVSDVTGVFGAGMNKTKIRFNWSQSTQANNSGILVKELDNKIIGDLAVQYTGEYYRSDSAYFGLIDGIQLDHTSNTLIKRVDVSGANRTGVRFDSIRYYTQNIKDSILNGTINPATLFLPKNNRIINSNIHNNRVAGIFGTFQRDLTVEGNTMSYNGHPNDGNAGYGFALGVGSYNDGVKIINNKTNNNYRKGIDVHDGDNILIQGNTSDSDRLFGIGIVARTFAMRNITIKDNTIKFNPTFHVFTDDTEPINVAFKEFWGIDLQTNYDNVHHDNGQAGNFIIDNNIITGLQDNRNDTNVRVSAIRFGFHDHHAYNLTINNNKASGPSADNFIRVTSKSQAPGQLLITNNSAQFDSVALTFVGVGVTSLPLGSSLSIQQNFLNGNIIVHKTMP